MKESTRKTIDWAIGVCVAAGIVVTPAGFKYHSEKLWLAVTDTADVVWLNLAEEAKPSLWIYRVDEDSVHVLTPKAESKSTKKKKAKT